MYQHRELRMKVRQEVSKDEKTKMLSVVKSEAPSFFEDPSPAESFKIKNGINALFNAYMEMECDSEDEAPVGARTGGPMLEHSYEETCGANSKENAKRRKLVLRAVRRKSVTMLSQHVKGEIGGRMDGVLGKLQEMAKTSAPLGKKLAIMQLKHKLEPHLHKQGLVWADVVPVLEMIDSVEELEEMMEDPMGKLQEMAETSVPLAKKLAIMHLKHKLEPYLRKQGLVWADVVPVLETIDSVEELEEMMEDPMGKLQEMAETSVPLATKLAIMYSKPNLESHLHNQ
jgi:hypothetical protein